MIRSRDRTTRLSLAVIAIILVGVVLYYTKAVAVLVALSAFLAILIQPAVNWLERHIPKWLALMVVFLGIGLLLTGIGLAFVTQARAVAAKAPEYSARFEEMLQGALEFASSLGIELTWNEVGTTEAITNAIGYVTSGIQSFLGFGAQTLVVLIMVIFMLLEANVFRLKIAVAFKADQRDKVTDSLDSATRKIQRYVVTKTLVSMMTGLITGLVTYAIGLDFPFIWGAIAFQLNFIPYLGSLIAVVPPTLIAFVQFPDPAIGAFTFFILGTVQFTIGNIIEPRIMGRNLALSPLVVFISMTFWGWFWGLTGIILSVPLTAVIKIVCEHIESLRPIAIMMGDHKDAQDAMKREKKPAKAAKAAPEG